MSKPFDPIPTDLSGPQNKILHQGLQSAFLNPNKFNTFLVQELSRLLVTYAGHGDPYPDQVFNVIMSAKAEGWIGRLVEAAYTMRPRNPDIANVASQLGITALGANLSNTRPEKGIPKRTPQRELESIIRGRERFIDFGDFLDGFGRLQSRICRIETTRKDGKPGDDICGITNGQFSLIDIIDHVLTQTGPADVAIATWTMGVYDAE